MCVYTYPGLTWYFRVVGTDRVLGQGCSGGFGSVDFVWMDLIRILCKDFCVSYLQVWIFVLLLVIAGTVVVVVVVVVVVLYWETCIGN